MNPEIKKLYDKIRDERNVSRYYGDVPYASMYANMIQQQMGSVFTGWSSGGSSSVVANPTVTYPNVKLPGGALTFVYDDITSTSGYKGGTNGSTILSSDVEMSFTQTGTAGCILYIGFSIGVSFANITNSSSNALVWAISGGTPSHSVTAVRNGALTSIATSSVAATSKFSLRRNSTNVFSYKIGLDAWVPITLPGSFDTLLSTNPNMYVGTWYYHGGSPSCYISIAMQPTS
jgi:hypothetical protein